MKTGLVLEGGGMRGLYTAGVLDYFLDKDIHFDYVIGVSAGACNGISYVARQKGRNYRINTGYVQDKRYISLENFHRTGSVFGMDFLFDTIPHELDVFDYETYWQTPCQFVVGATDVRTGQPVFFGKEDLDENNTILRASSSIPGFSPMVPFRGGYYLDGGTSDPIPAHKAIEDGCDRLVVVLTQEKGYQKSPERAKMVYSYLFRDYPQMIAAMDRRHKVYNQQLSYVHVLERQGKAVVLEPERSLGIGRFDRKEQKLVNAYLKGMKDASRKEQSIRELLIK